MSFVLGISSFFHDSAAALLENGEIVAAAQEERFTRKKHDASFPIHSINYVLSERKIELNHVEHIVFYEKPFLKFERLLETHVAFAPKGFKSFCVSMPLWLRQKLFQKNLIIKELKNINKQFDDYNRIKFSEHHLSHAASAFYSSPFRKAIFLTLDGVGEWATTTYGIGEKNNLKIYKEIHFPHSIGLLYSAFTYYLGFKVNSGEYKVMGLAPYGQPKYKNLIYDDLIDLKNDGSFRMNMSYFNYATDLTMINNRFCELFKNKRRESQNENLKQFHMNIAASIQSVTEDIILKMTSYLKKKYKINNLCLSGGVALNCVANGKILKKRIFENLWIQPASGDAGGALGAAQAFWFNTQKNQRTISNNYMKGAYLGPRYSFHDIKIFLDNIGAVYSSLTEDEMLNLISTELSNEKIIGWFQGRMEFGPRALGNRSILADPRSEKMQKQLNLKVKFRESFRPFAPAVLRERVSDFFDINTDSPYMLLVSDINPKIKIEMDEKDKSLFGIDKLNVKRSSLPVVTHVDYSSRAQTVHKETNPKFYKLIQKFEKLTSFPVLVNTSFNIRGEPIVCSPDDAYKCFMGTNLDMLVLENIVLYKDKQDEKKIHKYKNNFALD